MWFCVCVCICACATSAEDSLISSCSRRKESLALSLSVSHFASLSDPLRATAVTVSLFPSIIEDCALHKAHETMSTTSSCSC